MTMTLKNKIKKEMLLLKRERLNNYKNFQEQLESILAKENFELLDFELMNVVWLKLQSLDIDSRGKAIEQGASSYSVSEKFADFFNLINTRFKNIGSKYVFVFPDNWQKTGGLIVGLHDLMSSLGKIMYLYDDDLMIISADFSSVIYFRGDRMGDNLYSLDIICRGENWKNLIG